MGPVTCIEGPAAGIMLRNILKNHFAPWTHSLSALLLQQGDDPKDFLAGKKPYVLAMRIAKPSSQV